MGAACSNNNKVVNEATTVRKANRLKIQTDFSGKDTSVWVAEDKDQARFGGDRMHDPLWRAIETNNCAQADKFLTLNDVSENNMYDSAGQTMLHCAAAQGNCDMLMLLIERTGVKPDIVNQQLATPLHLACKLGKENVVKFLLGCGVDVNVYDEHGQTPLLICCLHSNRALVQMLVEASNSGQLQEPIEVNLPNHQGLTPLNCAAIKGDHEMVKCLVSRGSANVNQASPKGCTPLIYAGRGGHSKCIELLIEKKASAFKQDNAGGTVFHHAVEKGHISVLETMIGLGVDVHQAIEIADNAGRTPLFEAVETEEPPNVEMIEILTRPRSQNGYEANPNVVNYSGQTPLFSAARQGSLGAVQALIAAQADPDLNNGELVKPEECDPNEEFESAEEQYFFEAFKNCMSPLHVATVLGHDEIALYLVNQCGADVNLQTRTKGYSSLQLAVLANKPEMIIELLTKTQADPMLEDATGKSMLDMVYQFIPSYVETFQDLLETLNIRRLKQATESAPNPVVARHYVCADDERRIKGAKTSEEIQQLYAKQDAETQNEEEHQQQEESQAASLDEINEFELKTDGSKPDTRISSAFGRKAAMCLTSTNWQHKELALKYILRQTEKFLTRCEISSQGPQIVDIIEGGLAAVSLTCREKVIKVFLVSLQLFNMVVQSSRVERDIVGTQRLMKILHQEQLVTKLLLQSEQSNTRVTNRIHEALLDMSYQAFIGEDFVCFSVLDLLRKHNLNGQNHKGLHAQLALLYKLVNTFTVHAEQVDSNDSDDQKALTKDQIVLIVLPAVTHSKDDIRAAATKILLDVQMKTKNITLADLNELPDKVKETLWEKLKDTLVLIQDPQQPTPALPKELKSDEKQEELQKLNPALLEKYKQTISEKGQHKDWTQREIALTQLNECFSLELNDLLKSEEEFLAQCSILLQSSLDNNNIQIYLIAVEVVMQYILKAAQSEAVLDSLSSLMQSVALRTTDTNTRVRRRSVEVINQVWDIQLNPKATMTSSQVIANILCDPQLNERAIIGRLGIFIKKAMLIETANDISRRPLQLILGKDYEQIAQFACQWCLHKNTKVRQCALKLAVEICRLNCIDPRGNPFKQRIINMILGLRPSIRDPLIKKINEVCLQANPKCRQYIHETELELQMATKQRAASYDVRRVAKSGSRQGNRPTSSSGPHNNALPQIGNVSLVQQQNASRPTIVLPHSEPLTETQKEQAQSLIQLFGEELITCYYSQTWSSRFAAIQKVEEQLHNLDPGRRDAMLAEINRDNLPPEVSFKTLLKFFEEGLKDPVLKNYITILDLIQTSMPLYFRYLRAEQIRKELTPLIQITLQKTSDLKQKIREASINICLYLSHQSPIGPEFMTKLVLGELDSLSWEKQEVKKDVSNSFGNSSMIVSCLNLLSQYQQQTNLVNSAVTPLYAQYVTNINKALRHSNPQVRKEGEQLFKTMYGCFKEAFVKELKDQKPQLMTKLVAEARAENAEQSTVPVADVPLETQVQQRKEQAQVQVKEDSLNQPQIQQLMQGHADLLQQLKLPNPKKRVIAIVEIKKIVQSKLAQVNPKSIKDLVEPLSILLRFLLKDENAEVYMESLNLLKFFVGSVAQHLSSLDLHLMMGQFLTVLVSGQSSTNMRTRVASDKVIVFFAKHSNIGSLVVAKEVLKNIDRLNKSLGFVAAAASQEEVSIQDDKKSVLSRYYAILQMLLQQFSIVLLYQPEFYQKCIEALAETLAKSVNEPLLKSTCVQLTTTLYQIDTKVLDKAVNSLDFSKKAQLKKIIIELENSNQKGLISQNQNIVSGARGNSPDASFRDTQQSFTSLQSRSSIMSPSLSMNRRLSRDRGNSEIHHSRESGSTPKLPAQDSASHNWRRMQLDSNLTETAWNNNNQQSSMFPSITKQEGEQAKSSRRRQVGQGYAGASSKAAGFNRKDFNMTGDQSFNIQQQPRQANFGIGSGLIAPTAQNNKLEYETIDAMPNKPFSNDKPMYVPSVLSRTRTGGLRETQGYQPTIMTRPNQTTTSFGSNSQNPMMGSTTSSVGMIPAAAAAGKAQIPAPASFLVQRVLTSDRPQHVLER